MTKRESEFMGLKYHLGHTAYVSRIPDTVAGGPID